MKFVYDYRTSDNSLHHGAVTATSREAAFTELKKRGIRPASLNEAPGFFNKLFGKGKRWIAIAMLSLAVTVVVCANFSLNRQLADADPLCDDRAQLYGDPGILKTLAKDSWAAVFTDAGDRFLALHAIPGRFCSCADFKNANKGAIMKSLASCPEPVEIPAEDYEEVRKIKRIVNGMRREVSEYVKDGGSVESYIERLEERTLSEVQIHDRICRELRNSKDPLVWRARNAELRMLGLPMVNDEDSGDGRK